MPSKDVEQSTPRNATSNNATSNNAPLFSRFLSFSSQKSQGNNGLNVIDHTTNIIGTDTPHRSADRLDRMVDSFNDGKSSISESSCIGDGDSIYDVCETIDDSMLGLHTCFESNERVQIKISKDTPTRHDWILDGSDSEGEQDELLLLSPKTRRRRKFGDEALDQMLGMLELENASYTTTSCNSSIVEGENSSPAKEAENDIDEKDEMIEFAEFSQFDSECEDNHDDADQLNSIKKGNISVEVPSMQNNLQHDVLYEYGNGESCEEQSLHEDKELQISGNGIAQSQPKDTAFSPEYKPPQSIACLVSDLNAQLDVTIEQCLEPDKASVSESEGSSSHHDDDCANLLDAFNKESSPLPEPAPQQPQHEYKQPLLMSSLLLESLPVPMPSVLADDHVATLTRRVQLNHMAAKAKENNDPNSTCSIEAEDKSLEQKLADTIHPGYFGSKEENDDSNYFDTKVLEEVLNVPWPFHEIDLNESILNEDIELDSDDSVGIDPLNFNTYIANRLSELDFASTEIMSCILSRVSQKEDAINKGVENTFAAELEISAALLFTKSSRDILHHAKNGYQLPNSQSDHTHNVVSGGLEVIHHADSKARLLYLAQTLDQISSICDQEAQWWRNVSAKVIAPNAFQKLVDDARRLKELAQGEEVLNHSTGLATMCERIKKLPESLLGRVDESLADLFARMMRTEQKSSHEFDDFFLEYETLIQSWLSCCKLVDCSDQNATRKSRLKNIGAEWSSRILNIFCFEAGKCLPCATVDSYYDERIKRTNNDDYAAIDDIRCQLSRIKFDSKDGSDLDSLSQRLLVIRLGGGHHSSALSSTFFHLCSRLVELMSLYDVTIQWQKALIDRVGALHKPMVDISDVPDQSRIISDESESNAIVSSMTSDKQSISSEDDTLPEEEEQDEIPENLEFRRDVASNLEEYKSMLSSMELVRHALWKTSESALINLIEFYTSQCGDLEVKSGDSTDFATQNLQLTYDSLLQFTSFSLYFLKGDESGEEQFTALENELSELYSRHLRSIHIEAMKTTGTLLRHESWHLAPLQLPGGALGSKGNACKCDSSDQNCSHCKDTIIQAIYEAVGELILGCAHTEKAEHKCFITSRAEDHGYRYCSSFGQFLDSSRPIKSTTTKDDTSLHLQGCHGMSSNDFVSEILPLVEMKPCGERNLSILTQSSANGLMKWAARLLAIGNTLPLVADEASDAVMTLFDLYILTVLRFCAGGKSNEDVLLGFGRGTAACSATTTSVSLTMEADAVAPLPCEERDFLHAQKFIRSSRKRLENIVNLDKFESTSDDMMPPTSPRSKDDVSNFARRLEKKVAAACSCFFAAILADVACKLFGQEKDQSSSQQPLWADLTEMTEALEGDEDSPDADSLELYAAAAVSTMPNLVSQTVRFATVNAISGKELIFQIICCGRVWENHNMQEQPNTYVDNLCERSALLWGYMSSSMRLPSPVLQYTWNYLVRSAFTLLLEGFSKVPKCSTEGRSLMSMDLATLFHGFTPETVQAEIEDDFPNIGPPPQACLEEMMRYVDTFIKVFYFPNEDIINWIKDNSGSYHLDHALSLVTSKAAESKDKGLITYGKNSVMNFYGNLKIK